jgi:alpha-beta hydrolase superfamily lysophospholipase
MKKKKIKFDLSMVEENKFETPRGASLATYIWRVPRGLREPIALVFFAHGLFDCSMRYAELAERLASSGFEVHAMDIEGHGKSSGTRGLIHDYEDAVVDLHAFVCTTLVQEANLKMRFIIMAKAMGSILATHVVNRMMAESVRKPSAFVMISPAGKIKQSFSFFAMRKVVAKVASNVVPRMEIAAFNVDGMFRDPAERIAYLGDPLVVHGRIASVTAATMLKAMDLQEYGSIHCPVFIQAAEHELVVDRESALVLFSSVPSPLKVMMTYTQAYHDLPHEPQPVREAVLSDLVEFCSAALALQTNAAAAAAGDTVKRGAISRVVDLSVPGGVLTADTNQELAGLLKLLEPLRLRAPALNTSPRGAPRLVAPTLVSCVYCGKQYPTTDLVGTHILLRHQGDAMPSSPPGSPQRVSSPSASPPRSLSPPLPRTASPPLTRATSPGPSASPPRPSPALLHRPPPTTAQTLPTPSKQEYVELRLKPASLTDNLVAGGAAVGGPPPLSPRAPPAAQAAPVWQAATRSHRSGSSRSNKSVASPSARPPSPGPRVPFALVSPPGSPSSRSPPISPPISPPTTPRPGSPIYLPAPMRHEVAPLYNSALPPEDVAPPPPPDDD